MFLYVFSDLMTNAEKNGTVAKEQYGSRKRHSAEDHCLNKRLTFDILRQKKRPGTHLATDLLSCYDRIVHSVASLAMQQQGMPTGPIVCMFTTLQEMKHHIRTIFGDSTTIFDSTEDLHAVPLNQEITQTRAEEVIQGIGQGNGAGPQIWAVVSSPILEMLRTAGFVCFFKIAISEYVRNLLCGICVC